MNIHIFDYPDPRLSGLLRVVPTSPDNRASTVITFDSHLKTSLLIVTVMIIISVKFQQDDWARAVYYFILVILKYFQVCVSNSQTVMQGNNSMVSTWYLTFDSKIVSNFTCDIVLK